MYKAILHGKYRGIDKERDASEEDEVSYRSFYSGTEDFLTAGVFTRLSYLDSQILWKILKEAFDGKGFKKFSESMPSVGNLEDIQFWPSWKDKKGYRVEPDVFLKFENMNIIVEAKFGDAGNEQYDDQWRREWQGMKNLECSELKPEKTWLFAIGGISDKNSFEKWADDIRDKNTHFKFAFAGWQDLYDVLKKEQSPNRIIEDTISILEFHGYHTPVWLGELPEKICSGKLSINDDSICFLVKHRPLWTDWNEMSAPYPISHESLTRLQENFNAKYE